MRHLKKLWPLWVTLVVVVALIFALDAAQTRRSEINATATLVPMEGGVWRLHPDQGTARIYEWQSDEHFIKDSRYGCYFIFDGNTIYRYDNETSELNLYAENQLIDYTMGADGIVIDHLSSENQTYHIYYILRDSQRWLSVDWCEQPLSICTRAELHPDGDLYLQEIHHHPLQPLDLDQHKGIYTVATREDGLRCIVTNTVRHSVRQFSPWFEAALTDEIRIDIWTDEVFVASASDTAYARKTYTVLSSTEMSGPIIETEVWDLPRLKYPHLVENIRSWGVDYFYLTPLGGLYYNEWSSCVARFSDISEEQFANAQTFGGKLLIPTDEGTRVYAKFSGLGWVRFDLPVGIE